MHPFEESKAAVTFMTIIKCINIPVRAQRMELSWKWERNCVDEILDNVKRWIESVQVCECELRLSFKRSIEKLLRIDGDPFDTRVALQSQQLSKTRPDGVCLFTLCPMLTDRYVM